MNSAAGAPRDRARRLLPRPLDALAQIIICGIGLVDRARRVAEPVRDEHIGEFFALLLALGAGMAFFVAADNLMTMFLGLEWFSIALYVMCAIDYDSRARWRPASST